MAKHIMPDVVGMGLKDAIYLLENNGMQVHINGAGRVKEQSVPVGTAITKGSKVILKLG